MDLVLGQPATGLRRPILVAGFNGWGDAGSAASIALRHILTDEPPSASAMLDPSACYDFTVARPLTSRASNGEDWLLEYPKVAFYPIRLDDAERDLLIALGPEPHFRWPQLAPSVVQYARASGVEMTVTLGGFVGPVSHRTTTVTGRALAGPLRQRLKDLLLPDSHYEGPTGFATALLHASDAVGLPSASLWVATPPYLQSGNPVAALALLRATGRVLDVTFDDDRLREVADTFLHDVDAALEEHPDLADQLREMLEAEAEELESEELADRAWHDLDLDRPPPDAPPGLPTGKGLVEAVERYLRQARGDDDP